MRKLGGRPLIEHVIRRIEPQVDALWLSASGASKELIQFGLPIVRDADPQTSRGPLAGIVATLGIAKASGYDSIAIVPCDAPFVPLDLVRRLAKSLDATGGPGVVVKTARGLQPTFGLWSVTLRDAARNALEAGQLELRLICGKLGLSVLDWRLVARDNNDFLNVNTEQDFEEAKRHYLARGATSLSRC